MAIRLYFGLPGCGKTTLLTRFAYKATRGSWRRRYRHVYANFPVQMEGVKIIDPEWLGKYDIRDALVLIDEATLMADSRNYKTFTEAKKRFFILHRHYHTDIILATQQWDAVDRKIRVLTDRVYYLYKGVFLGRWFTRMYRVPYGIIIPDPKEGGDKLGEIVQGYCKPNWLVRLLTPPVFRPRWYRYFDSFEAPVLDPLPDYDPLDPTCLLHKDK